MDILKLPRVFLGLDVCRTLAIFFAIMVLGMVAVCMPGKGVSANLDATKGINAEAFFVSQESAFSEMSQAQKDAFEWAVARLDRDDFASRYGSRPSVRSVVIGEMFRQVDYIRSEIAEAKKVASPDFIKAQRIREMIASHAARMQERMQSILKNASVRIRGVDLSTTQSKPEIIVRYTVSAPARLKLASIPCTLSYRALYVATPHVVQFNCLAPERTGNEHVIGLTGLPSIRPEEVVVTLNADFSNAQGNERKRNKVSSAPPAIPLAVQKIEAEESELKRILAIRSQF